MKTNWLTSLFKRKTDKSDHVPLSLVGFEDAYPPITLSEKMNGQAYNLFFLIENKCNDALIDLVQKYTTHPFLWNRTKECLDLSSEHNTLLVNIFPDFNGSLVHIITNEMNLVKEIIETKLTPPNPEISFPDVIPTEYGSLQGDIDFWFTWLWQPYWKQLSKTDKIKLNLSREWQEFCSERD